MEPFDKARLLAYNFKFIIGISPVVCLATIGVFPVEVRIM
jgi:hypothetical protein